MNAGKDISYEEAKKIANKTLKAIADNNIEDHECIDVQIARAIGVRPLPMRVHRQVPADNTVVVDDSTVQKKPEAASSETTTNAPKEKKKKEVKTEETVVSTAEVPSAEQPTGNEITTSDESAAKKDIVYTKEEYKAFADDLSHISIDNFYEKQSKRVIKDAIAEIVAVEGPISQLLLLEA